MQYKNKIHFIAQFIVKSDLGKYEEWGTCVWGGCCSWSFSLGYREKAKLHKLSAYIASPYCHIVLWLSYKTRQSSKIGLW